jgi:tRNA dimethylallyltransferase
MDIGTAKPSADEQAAVPHHLIDIRDPSESYSVMQFREDALRLIQDIHARGKLPLLVGGTMLYFKGLRDGLDELPQADLALRAQLDMEATRHGMPAMHARLAELDPITAARLKPNDSQRIQRALEIIALTGKPMSELLARTPPATLPFELVSFALEPSDRSVLHDRIAYRFDQMLKSDPGLLDEVRALKSRPDLHPGLPSMRCVGYRQAWEYLEGKISEQEFREKGIAATRQLAKRQLTWLRGMMDRIVVDCLVIESSKLLLKALQG